MLTICAGLFVFITKLGSDDFPIDALVVITLLCDFLLAFISIGLLFEGILQDLVTILGGCR